IIRGGILHMDHDAVVRQNMTERYLLNELDPEARDEFEEHYFDCPDCAADVQAGALFVEQSKVVLGSEESKGILSERPAASPVQVPVPVPASSGWFTWLRPVFAVPVLALLLAVIGYQNRFYPKGRQRLRCKCPSPYRRVPDGSPGCGLYLPCLFLPCCWP